MTEDPKAGAQDRVMIESNVRRIVGVAALLRIQRLVDERGQVEHVIRARVAPIAVIAMIIVAALIWTFGSPRIDTSQDALPECAPPRGQNITI